MLCAGDIVLFIIFIIPIFPKRTTLIFKVDVSKTVSFAKMDRFSKLENLKRNQKILWQGNSHEVQFYTTNAEADLNFNNIHSLTIMGNTTCVLPGIILKNLPYNQELVIGHDNGVRSDAVFCFKKININLGIFYTRGVAEDIHLTGFNTLIVEY